MANTNPIYMDYCIDMSSNNNFIQVPAVQGDGGQARYIRITLTENNVVYNIPNNVNAVIVGTKSDGTEILNYCTISDNVITAELTYQMTASPGRNTYQILLMDELNNSQIKSFPFYIVVTESFNAEYIDSSDEFQVLLKAIADSQHAYEDLQTYVEAAAQSAINSENSRQAARTSETNAKASELAAKTSETNAKTSEINTKASETNATNSATSASNFATNSANSATTATNKAKDAEAWAVGQRNGVDVPSSDVTYQNNSKYWAQRAADWSQHDASHLTYTLEDGTQVNLATFLKIIEDLDGETLLLL